MWIRDQGAAEALLSPVKKKIKRLQYESSAISLSLMITKSRLVFTVGGNWICCHQGQENKRKNQWRYGLSSWRKQKEKSTDIFNFLSGMVSSKSALYTSIASAVFCVVALWWITVQWYVYESCKVNVVHVSKCAVSVVQGWMENVKWRWLCHHAYTK